MKVLRLTIYQEKVFEDTEKANCLKKLCFELVIRVAKTLTKNFLTGATSEISVALGTASNNVERNSMSDTRHVFNKRITTEKIRGMYIEMDRNKGIDLHNWHPCLIKVLQVFTISLLLRPPKTCLVVGFWPFRQASLKFLFNSSEKGVNQFRLSLHQFSIACR